MIEKEEIKKVIPYKEPFLFLDGITNIVGNRIAGFYQTKEDDYYFKGHLVGFPIMPGSLMVEALGQLSTFFLRKKMGPSHINYHFLAYDIRSAQFLKPVFPGEKIILKDEILGFYDLPPQSNASKLAHIKGQVFVGEELKCEARFSIVVIEKKKFYAR